MKTLKKLIAILKKKKLSVALAESCSGGYASYLLTKLSGSSKVFKGGIIVYTLEAKNKFFKIPFKSLKKTQGVSKDIALVLAKKVRQKLNADIGGSLVGFAGPKTKKGIKVGTVLMSVADKKGILIKKVVIKGSRDRVRKNASKMLINLIYERINQ